jgi:tetratricopeptide (TPR) repeat protein
VNEHDLPAESSPWPRRIILLGIVLLAMGLIGYAAWPRPVAEVPEIPDEIVDPEVRSALERVRSRTLAEPASDEAWGELGLALLANLFDRNADACFAEAARLDPDDIRWPYARAIIASKRNPAETIPLLRQAAAGRKPGPEYRSNARLLLAETLLQEGEFDEAERIFQEELPHPGSRDRATLGLGLLARARGDEPAAIEHLTAAREHPSSRKQATIQLAALARARGNVASAEALQEETYQLPDDRPWPDPMLNELARYKVGRRARERSIADLERDRDFQGAARAYMQQAQERPTADAYVGAAANYARIQEYEAAHELLDQALELEPESSKAHYTRALVFFIQAERALAEDLESGDAMKWLRETVVSGRKATELKPDHAQAYLMWGMALQHLGESEAAIEPLQAGVACRPELFDLQFALGEALLAAGKPTEARQHLEHAQRLRPDDPRPQRSLQKLSGSS